ncbi:MAG: WYL domain-containing protein [Lachnospiraceae bacterium]|nr:WYL domain-containing protein [Lachnospiraceae bacterium]
MGFVDKNNYPMINDEQKIRIPLSDRAKIIIAEDMDVFNVSKTSTFINTVFHNFKSEATSSVSLYLQQREIELDNLFSQTVPDSTRKKKSEKTIDELYPQTALDDASRKKAINIILNAEAKKILEQTEKYVASKGEGKLYRINDKNKEYLLEECEENRFYSRPGQYVRSVIEEYCSLPFIKRERIYKKEVYDIINRACTEKRILKIKADYYGKEQLFYVYPYKIVLDTFHTQSYLVCYSRKAEETEKDKTTASFSMARVNMPAMLTKTFYLSKQEITDIENQISRHSPAYLVGKTERIGVRLTEKGKRSYQQRLYSRPERIQDLSSDADDIYVFDCTQLQIYNYFFSFGAEAEIIYPEELRARFKRDLENALKNYEKRSCDE